MGLIVQPPQFSLYQNSLSSSPASAMGTSVAANSTPNTKAASFTQLIASTSFDAQLLVVKVSGSYSSNTDTSMLLDIAIGAAAGETVIVPNLLCGYGGSASNGVWVRYPFPLAVPAGSRISACAQAAVGSQTCRVLVELFGGPRDPASVWCGSQVVAYGITLASSKGQTVTAGNSGSEGSATAIGTTTQAHSALVVGCQGAGTYTASIAYHFDVGIDTSSTSWLAQDCVWINQTSGEVVTWSAEPIFAPVPSGTVLVMAGEASGTANNLDFALYGVS